jgi:DNA polymerase I-like protein with 3'-5' exonuclease and polymerase domains
MNLKTGRLSFAKDILEKMDTPYTEAVLELKSLNAVEKYFKIADRTIDPTGHITFQWVDGITGRLYAKEPCVISFPGEVRECIIPEEGKIFLSGDYVNQELSIIAHIVGEHQLINDIKAGLDPFTVISEAMSVVRDDVKTCIYAYMYGSKPEHIATKLYQPIEKVNAILTGVFSRYPQLKEWAKTATYVDQEGRSRTLFGDEYVIDRGDYDHDKQVRRAVNHIAQGSAAGVLRRLIDKINLRSTSFWRFVVAAHDCVVVECDRDRVHECSTELRSIMEDFLNGDLTVKMSIGTNWREAWESDVESSGVHEEVESGQ